MRVYLGNLFAKKRAVLLSREEFEQRFWEAENDRVEVYERTRRQQQLGFVLAATPWTKGEEARNDLFQRFLLDALETFSLYQERRVSEFKEVVDRHDKIFRSSDKIRQVAFDDATAKRVEIFREIQEKREKALESYKGYQERLYEDGRRGRETEFQTLITLLREQFEKTMRGEEAAFAVAQRKREERIMAITVS